MEKIRAIKGAFTARRLGISFVIAAFEKRLSGSVLMEIRTDTALSPQITTVREMIIIATVLNRPIGAEAKVENIIAKVESIIGAEAQIGSKAIRAIRHVIILVNGVTIAAKGIVLKSVGDHQRQKCIFEVQPGKAHCVWM